MAPFTAHRSGLTLVLRSSIVNNTRPNLRAFREPKALPCAPLSDLHEVASQSASFPHSPAPMRYHLAAAISLGVLTACIFPTTTCGCSPPPVASAVIVGTIRTANALPLAGAVVRAQGTRGARCSRSVQFRAVSQGTVTTDATGRYRFLVDNAAQAAAQVPDTLCVEVIARRSSSATADSLIAPTVTVVLRYGLTSDSARVDLQFP